MMEWWNGLPAGTRRLLAFGVPVIVGGIFATLAWQDLGKLGPDPRLDAVRVLQRDEPGSLWATIATTNEKIAAERLVAAKKPALEKRLAALTDEVELLYERLPTATQKDEMQRRIKRMIEDVPADVGQIEYVSLAIKESANAAATSRSRRSKATHSEVIYSCEINADMNGVIYFLNRFEEDRRFMALRRLDLTPGAVVLDSDTREIV
ncbi:MAG: hypothetical protein ACYTF0_04345, partial [Planctomycetota bacterium]